MDIFERISETIRVYRNRYQACGAFRLDEFDYAQSFILLHKAYKYQKVSTILSREAIGADTVNDKDGEGTLYEKLRVKALLYEEKAHTLYEKAKNP